MKRILLLAPMLLAGCDDQPYRPPRQCAGDWAKSVGIENPSVACMGSTCQVSTPEKVVEVLCWGNGDCIVQKVMFLTPPPVVMQKQR